MRLRVLAITGCFAVASIGAAGCGDDDGGGGGNKLTIYSSLPLQGASRPQTTTMVKGIKLALEEADNKVGKFDISYKSLDDSTAQAGNWDPGQVSANARKAAQDDSAIVYLGEFNSGASAISIPLLNRAGIPQISPANTYVGLTTNKPGSEKGEPDKFYPTGKRTYTRIVPADDIQAAALVSVMKEDGCKNAYVTNDKETYGAGLSRNIEIAAKDAGFEILGNAGIDPKTQNYRSLASKIKGEGADCFLYSGITANNAAKLFKDVNSALPDAGLYGPDGIAESGFADPKEGGISADIAAKTKVTVATLSPEEYIKREIPARAFFDAYAAKYGDKSPDPYAIYGYEAMRLALDAIKRAGADGNDRNAVLKQLFATKGRKSVLGEYDIDKNGDTTITVYGVYTIKDGELIFDKAVEAQQ